MNATAAHFLKTDGALFELRRDGCALVHGDAQRVLRTLAPKYFQCCVTSPPYWGMRDYGFPEQIGAEARVDAYIARLVDAFREIRRVLKDDGTLWLNLGDTYTSGDRGWRDSDRKNPARAMTYRPPTPEGLKPKDLIGIPWRVAFALQADGWYLRSEVIWHKPNCQPESVKDRPTRAHEHVFLFTKNERYYYNQAAVVESVDGGRKTRNRRSIWSLNTEPFLGAHFATFPRTLVELCVLSSTRQPDVVLDPFFGSGTVGVVSQQLGRRFVGIELKPQFIELAERRLGWRR